MQGDTPSLLRFLVFFPGSVLSFNILVSVHGSSFRRLDLRYLFSHSFLKAGLRISPSIYTRPSESGIIRYDQALLKTISTDSQCVFDFQVECIIRVYGDLNSDGKGKQKYT
ncbi:hypothetical protein DFJ43DRAFT_1045173 [Lentinula guzmanii]|uniref:Uncharacterized protein n=1 Tax=Lentinula guzmanii TaxID=2804957 RepID=A0AA38JXQ1_9AGAR|nr:hypothetical protein DFJ43DRAFT_1045173 [Lentinula guzmanii]